MREYLATVRVQPSASPTPPTARGGGRSSSGGRSSAPRRSSSRGRGAGASPRRPPSTITHLRRGRLSGTPARRRTRQDSASPSPDPRERGRSSMRRGQKRKAISPARGVPGVRAAGRKRKASSSAEAKDSAKRRLIEGWKI